MTSDAKAELDEAERNVALAINEGGLSTAENALADAIMNLIEVFRLQDREGGDSE